MLKITNNQTIELDKIKKLDYDKFYSSVVELLNKKENHCVNYFAYPIKDEFQFFIAIADDKNHDIVILSHQLNQDDKKELKSLTEKIFSLHIFEREIYENYGIKFIGHPWLKPVRYPSNRANKTNINDYPFYTIKSNELHEVGVGPIHAGIIEPGHFRFICNGENVLHLEIQLGWQHRGIEQLFLEKKNHLQRNILAENIAGDTVIGHTTAFAQTLESLANFNVSEQLHLERALALELERIAIHTGDIGALCVDAAYHLGANVFGILRTAIINFIQAWCGNRFGKSLIRLGGSNFPFTKELRNELFEVLKSYEKKFEEMARITYRLTSIQNRFELIGTITEKQARIIGTVGLSARMANVLRDVRETHPNIAFQKYPVNPVVLKTGDVMARFVAKKREIRKSISWIRDLLNNFKFKENIEKPNYSLKLKPQHFSISLCEGWRGEICHCAITDKDGALTYYKVKDPSLHNWKVLELSLRNVEISDFPINNKSYNLSYCGNDL